MVVLAKKVKQCLDISPVNLATQISKEPRLEIILQVAELDA